MQRGRKSLKEEIKIVERLCELSEPTFKFIKSCYESGDKPDKKWAAEQMIKLYAKCIPTELGGDPDNPIVITWQSLKSPTIPESGQENSTTPSSDGSSLSSTGEPEKQPQS